jgi:hypothetical protein
MVWFKFVSGMKNLSQGSAVSYILCQSVSGDQREGTGAETGFLGYSRATPWAQEGLVRVVDKWTS